jgi:hypothetical protein
MGGFYARRLGCEEKDGTQLSVVLWPSEKRLKLRRATIVPVNAMTAGEVLLKEERDAQGWELIAVQALRTQADLTPKMQNVQAQADTAQFAPPPAASGKSEALYFFRRAKRK